MEELLSNPSLVASALATMGIGYPILIMFLRGKLPTPKERAILLSEIKKRDRALEKLSNFVFNDVMGLIEQTGTDVSIVKDKVEKIEKEMKRIIK